MMNEMIDVGLQKEPDKDSPEKQQEPPQSVDNKNIELNSEQQDKTDQDHRTGNKTVPPIRSPSHLTTSRLILVPEQPEVDVNVKEKSHRFYGIFFALCATICISVSTFVVKYLQRYGYSIYLSIFWRFLGIIVPSIPMLLFYQYYLKKPVLGSIWPLGRDDRPHWRTLGFIAIRSLIGTLGFLLQYTALKYISIGDTSVITYSSPIFVLGFSCCCLHEKCGWYPTFVTLLTICGVILIAHPSFIFPATEAEKRNEGNKLIGICYALGAMMCTALVIVVLRCLKDVHFTLTSVIFGFVGVMVGLILSLTILDSSGSHTLVLPRKGLHTVLFISLAVLSFFGQLFLTLALKFEEAGTVAVVRTLDSVVSFTLEAIAGLIPSVFSICGGIIVIASVTMIAFRKYLLNKQEEDPNHPCVKRLWFVLK